jgi:hypothetical protein
MFMDFRAGSYHLEQLFNIDTQFMLGTHIMVSPVITPGERKKKTYFPDEQFFNFYTGEAMNPEGEIIINVEAGLGVLPLFVRAGFITPVQDADNSIVKVSDMRKKPIELIVALDANNRAAGRIFFDDGETNKTLKHKEYYRMDVVAGQPGEHTIEISFKYFDMHFAKSKFIFKFLDELEYPYINKIKVFGVKKSINKVEHVFTGEDGKVAKNEESNHRPDNVKKVYHIRDLKIPMTDKNINKLILTIDSTK